MVVALPSYAAIDCTTPPTCAELGYKQTASNCAGLFMLKCPFDETAVFCGGGDCAALGYTETSCGTYYHSEECPDDPTKLKCTEMTAQEKCAVDGYTVTACASGYYASSTCSFSSTYKKCALDSCSVGYLPTSANACACINGSKANGYKSKGGKSCVECCGTGELCPKCAK